MIEHVGKFIDYFNSVRRRTLTFARVTPPDRMDWSPKEGEFTCADILRHIAAGEKMFVGVALHGKWKYEGHIDGPGSLPGLIAHLEQTHAEAMEALRALPNSELLQPRPPLEGDVQIKTWRWLMAMVEHEIHHRSQLALYLTLLGVTPPHLYGLGVEDLIARATG